MTPRQRALLEFIADYWMRYGYAPLYEEMQDALGLASKSGVNRLLNGLIERGYLARRKFACARNLHILKWPRGPMGTQDAWRFDPQTKGLVKIEKPPAPARGRAAWTGESVEGPHSGEVVGTAPVHDQRNKG